jgi:hypothetical protein
MHSEAETEGREEAIRRFSRLMRTRLKVCQDFHFVQAKMKILNEFHNE